MTEKQKPGGRVPHDPENSANKLDEQRRIRNQSPKQREAEAKYRQSEKGKAAHERYNKGPLFKVSLDKYQHSDKGQKALAEITRRRHEKQAIANRIKTYLKHNPGKTVEDFFKDNPDAVEGGSN